MTFGAFVALATLTTACLDGAEPERIVVGTISDTNDAPLVGAVVAVGDAFAVTNAQGEFVLEGLPADGPRSITAAAEGHTAWTLDTSELAQFTARLRPRVITGSPQASVAVSIELPEPALEPRTVFLATDQGQIVPVEFFAGQQTISLNVPLPQGQRQLAAISPSPGGMTSALWVPARAFALGEFGASVNLALTRTSVVSQAINITIDEQGSPPSGFEAALACNTLSGASFLTGHTARPTHRGQLDIFPIEGIERCEMIVSYTLDTPLGEVRHVAFLGALPLPSKDGTITIRAPGVVELLPTVDTATGTIEWDAAPGAALYDVFIAPDEQTRVGVPLWSATTEKTALRLPDLPEPAAALFQDCVFGPCLVRVVARYAPGLDIEDNWDWSGYYGHVSSPWLTLPQNALSRWRLDNADGSR